MAEMQPGEAQRKSKKKNSKFLPDKGGPEYFVSGQRFAKDRDTNIQ
jgi:hypothetical protein